jgi:NAD(P)-dependent dehydrogenase (short-subunit alcohol dehydrogenase family)
LFVNNEQIEMENKIVLFAGGTSGLGKVAVCDLANKGATVVVTSRNEKKEKELIDYFNQNFTNAKGKIDLLDCNLSSFQSITAAVEKFKKIMVE